MQEWHEALAWPCRPYVKFRKPAEEYYACVKMTPQHS